MQELADEMDDIEKEYVKIEQVVGSIADVGAIQKYSAELSWLAAVALLNQIPTVLTMRMTSTRAFRLLKNLRTS